MSIDSLSTRRLGLRAFTNEDIVPLHRILSDPAVLRYMPRRDPWPIDKVKMWVEMGLTQWDEKGYSWWAVELKEIEELIGWCGLNHLKETDEIEVLYLIGEEYWGRGLATEAALASVQYAFEVVGVDAWRGLLIPRTSPPVGYWKKLGCHSIKGHITLVLTLTHISLRDDL